MPGSDAPAPPPYGPASRDDHAAGAASAVDPEQVLAAAEDAHLAARRTAPAQRGSAGAAAPAGAKTSAGAKRAAQPDRAAPPTRRRLARWRPGGGGPSRPRRRIGQLAVAAGVAAGWAAVQGFLAVLLVMVLVQLAAGQTGSLGALARLGAAGWLLGHGVPLRTGLGTLGLAPLAVSVFAAWRVARAGVHVIRAIRARRTGSARIAFTVAVAIALAYALIGAIAAAALDGPGVGVSATRAALNLGVFGLVAAGVGGLGATGALEAAFSRAPVAIGEGLRTGVVAALVVLGAGAGLAGLALAIAGGDAADTIAVYRTGVAGQAGITLLCLAYAPNAATWAAAYLLGPGFGVGLETTVRTTEVSVGALPAVPLFAGLPSGSLGDAGMALLAVPLVAGMAAGALLVRRSMRGGGTGRAGWSELLVAAALAGPVAGLVLGLASAASSGPLGGGRLAEVGPAAVQVGMVAAGVVMVGALLGTVAARAVSR
jgi:Family of unknown function (DUF6350)